MSMKLDDWIMRAYVYFTMLIENHQHCWHNGDASDSVIIAMICFCCFHAATMAFVRW